MTPLVIDIESYYSTDYQLRKLSTEEYVRDRRFQTIGVGVRTFDNQFRHWFEHEHFKAWAAQLDWSQFAVLAHHAHFDGLILSHHYGVSPGYWFDTLSMANAIHGPTVAKSLDKLAERYGIGRKGREVHDFKGMRREDFTPEQHATYGRYCLNDCDLEYDLFLKLLPALPQRREHDLIDMTIRMFTEPELCLNQSRMEDYLAYERSRKAALLERTGQDKSVFMSNDKFAALLVEMGVEPGVKLSPAALKRGETEYVYAFAKSDEFMKGLLEHDDPDVRAAAECRIGAKSTMNETRTERYLSTWKRGPLPVYLKYGAAGTFRWGGGDKTNWQNMERTNKKNPRKGTLRKSIEAPPGKALVVVDSSQIEARVNAALNNETWLIEAFANRRDVYSEFASVVYNRTIDRKKNPEDEMPGFVAKTAVLGLGFQMWWPKFALTLLAGAMGGAPMHFVKEDMDRMGIDPGRFLNNPKQVERAREIPTRLTTDEILIHSICCDEVVKRYRQKNNRIVGGSMREPTNSGWRYAQDVVLPLMESLAEGQYVRLDGFSVEIHATRHGIVLPNGMTMHYPGLERRGDQWSFMGGKSGKEREYTYGGKIIENIVQALARIVVGYQLLAMRTKYAARIKMTTHDEGVMLVVEARAPELYQLALNEFRTPPWWCPWLPLDAEGGFGKVYGDIK